MRSHRRAPVTIRAALFWLEFLGINSSYSSQCRVAVVQSVVYKREWEQDPLCSLHYLIMIMTASNRMWRAHLNIRAELFHRFDQLSRVCFAKWKRIVTAQHYSVLKQYAGTCTVPLSCGQVKIFIHAVRHNQSQFDNYLISLYWTSDKRKCSAGLRWVLLMLQH